jgi:hypothetical protein
MPDQPATTATQATAVATPTETRPTGRSNGIFRPPTQPTRMNANATSPIQGASHIWATGRIEMNVRAMPARAPSMAARGTYLRM